MSDPQSSPEKIISIRMAAAQLAASFICNTKDWEKGLIEAIDDTVDYMQANGTVPLISCDAFFDISRTFRVCAEDMCKWRQTNGLSLSNYDEEADAVAAIQKGPKPQSKSKPKKRRPRKAGSKKPAKAKAGKKTKVTPNSVARALDAAVDLLKD